MATIERKNAYNKRPFFLLSEAKALGFIIKVDLQHVGKSRNYDGDQKDLPKNTKNGKIVRRMYKNRRETIKVE